MFARFSVLTFAAAIFTVLLLVSLYATEAGVVSRRLRDPSWTALREHESAPSTTQDIGLSTSRHIDAHKVSHDVSTGTLLGWPLVAHHRTSNPNPVLVISTLRESNDSWIDSELSQLLQPGGGFSAKIYVNDNRTAPLHTPANKGHEAMGYLTYIIDTYYELPSVSVFIHGHPLAWHNNILLDMSTSEMIRNLRLDKVEQDGYFNLRCHWNPGCPEHLYPFATQFDNAKPEESLIKDAWKQIFEVEEAQIPPVLAQACCSQFAVTADRIRTLPLEKYVRFRDWILESQLPDDFTGRVFEYFWQYIFNGTPVFCPDTRVCYCEGYGICFENPDDYDQWFYLKERLHELEHRLDQWKLWYNDEDADKAQESPGHKAKAQPWLEPGPLVQYYKKLQKPQIADPRYQPPYRRGEWLTQQIADTKAELGRRRQEAHNRGADSAARIASVNAVKGLAPPVTEDAKHGGWQKKRDLYV